MRKVESHMYSHVWVSNKQSRVAFKSKQHEVFADDHSVICCAPITSRKRASMCADWISVNGKFTPATSDIRKTQIDYLNLSLLEDKKPHFIILTNSTDDAPGDELQLMSHSDLMWIILFFVLFVFYSFVHPVGINIGYACRSICGIHCVPWRLKTYPMTNARGDQTPGAEI